MFKGIVGKAVKNLLIDPITNPPEPPAAPVPEPTAPPARTQRAVVPAQRAEDTLPKVSPPPPVRIELETYGIDLPYHPGEGTDCGAACRCRWQIDKRWSEADNAFAIHVTWQSTGDAKVCPDCQRRASEWNDVLIRFVDE